MSFIIINLPSLYWPRCRAVSPSPRRSSHVSASVHADGPGIALHRMAGLCWKRDVCFSVKNNCWGFVVVSVMFSSPQSLAWVVFPAIFLSYQPYNFIVKIRCGMSLDAHLSRCLCRANRLPANLPNKWVQTLFHELLLILFNFWDPRTKRKSSDLSLLILIFIFKYVSM